MSEIGEHEREKDRTRASGASRPGIAAGYAQIRLQAAGHSVSKLTSSFSVPFCYVASLLRIGMCDADQEL